MRKILAILMIGILLAPVMGMLAVFHLYRYQIRKEVAEIIIRGMKEEWVDLAFSSAEIKTKLKWKHSMEFELEGQMYDIVRQRIEGDTFKFTTIGTIGHIGFHNRGNVEDYTVVLCACYCAPLPRYRDKL